MNFFTLGLGSFLNLENKNMSFESIMLAIALLLIIEGVGPLLFPRRWQAYLKEISNQNQAVLQRVGGAFVTAGIILLIIFS